MPNNVLISAPPRTGKSTLIKKVIHESRNYGVGFRTEEILKNGKRKGFRVITSEESETILASTRKLWPRVGRYGIYVNDFEELLPKISDFKEDYCHPYLYMDEIGKMQMKSKHLGHFVNLYLNAKNPSIGTIPDPKKYDCKFLTEIRERKDVYVINLTKKNFEETYSFLRAFLKGPS